MGNIKKFYDNTYLSLIGKKINDSVNNVVLLNGTYGTGKTTLISELSSLKIDGKLEYKCTCTSMWDDSYQIDPYMLILSHVCLGSKMKKFNILLLFVFIVPLFGVLLSFLNNIFYEPIFFISDNIYNFLYIILLILLCGTIFSLIVFFRLEIYTLFYSIHLTSNSLFVDSTMKKCINEICKYDFVFIEDLDRLEEHEIANTIKVLNKISLNLNDKNTKIILTCDIRNFNKDTNIENLRKLEYSLINLNKITSSLFIDYANFNYSDSIDEYDLKDYMSNSQIEYNVLDELLSQSYENGIDYRLLKRWREYTSEIEFLPDKGLIDYVTEFSDSDNIIPRVKALNYTTLDTSSFHINNFMIDDIIELLSNDNAIYTLPSNYENNYFRTRKPFCKKIVYNLCHHKNGWHEVFLDTLINQLKNSMKEVINAPFMYVDKCCCNYKIEKEKIDSINKWIKVYIELIEKFNKNFIILTSKVDEISLEYLGNDSDTISIFLDITSEKIQIRFKNMLEDTSSTSMIVVPHQLGYIPTYTTIDISQGSRINHKELNIFVDQFKEHHFGMVDCIRNYIHILDSILRLKADNFSISNDEGYSFSMSLLIIAILTFSKDENYNKISSLPILNDINTQEYILCNSNSIYLTTFKFLKIDNLITFNYNIL